MHHPIIIHVRLPVIALCQPAGCAAVITGHPVTVFEDVGSISETDELDITQHDVTVVDEVEVDFLVIRCAAEGPQLLERVLIAKGLPI